MSCVPLSVGFMPLVDAAPLVVAHEMGFDREEGLQLNLIKAPSWSLLRDMLAFGRVEAAHMLSPIPVAMALGLGGLQVEMDALQVLSVNGNMIGVSRDLEQRLRDRGFGFDFQDAHAAGRALVSVVDGPLKIGVPFPFSMHAELLYHWLDSVGLGPQQGLQVKTVPPPLMADAMACGEIDAFCVGEPWGSIAVENRVGALLLPGRAIWTFAPEKVLAVRKQWAEAEPDLTARLMRAVWRAGRWLGTGGQATTAAELLSRPAYVDQSSEVIDRALSGQLVISPAGDIRQVPGFVEFWQGAASFPWRSQAAWIGVQIAGRMGLDPVHAAEQASAVFRTDLYRQNLTGAGAVMPGASQKTEGGIATETAVASVSGRLILAENRFHNGQIFDPATLV